jgi:hypothetical protein
VVDNLDGPTGATPTGDVTVKVSILQADPRAPQAALSTGVTGVVVLTLLTVPALVRRYIVIAGRIRLPPLPPPPDP